MSDVQTTMPRYQSHKKVWALKIASIAIEVEGDTGTTIITPADEGFSPFVVNAEYVDKHKPHPGGYFVQYEDGYASFSPAEAFESGYTRI